MNEVLRFSDLVLRELEPAPQVAKDSAGLRGVIKTENIKFLIGAAVVFISLVVFPFFLYQYVQGVSPFILGLVR